MKKLLTLFALAPLAALAQSLSLGDAYRLALQNDANLAAVRSATDARRERVPQARAQLLPNVQANATKYTNDLESVSPNIFTGAPQRTERDYLSSTRALVVRQPLFRPALFSDYRQAKAQVADAEAQLDKEVQNLSVRVTTAYLQALLADDQLRLVGVQKTAYTTQLTGAQSALRAGSGTRTDIDEAQARVDLIVAQELEARQNVDFTRRNLGALVNQPVTTLATVDAARLPLVPPVPNDLQAWIARAENASPELRALNAQREAARHEVEKAKAGHLPTLDAIAQWSRNESDNVNTVNTTYENKQVGVQLTVPLFSGGMVSSQVRQAQAEQQRVVSALEATRRDLGLRVEREFRGMTEGVLRVRALEQAVASAETATESAKRSFQGGARTRIDVLNAEEKRVSALRDLAEARYVYVLSRIKLLALVGEADQAAVDQVDAWLKR
ncbi:MAG: TolC family outer membrane protein [Burkholderiales bacterium]|nr:TolC family outer membrane protein [Burkholderiales bacterium]